MIRDSFKSFPIWMIELVLICSAQAQDPSLWFSRSLSVGAGVHFGFTNPANLKLESIQNGRSFLGEIYVSSQTEGKKTWQQTSGYPAIGLDFLFGRSGSSQYIGNIAALVPIISGSIYKKNSFKLGWRFGLGPGWVQKPFNPQTNEEDLVIGSHLNACILLQMTSSVRVHQKIYLDFGLSFTHLSNGSIKLPNLGLNMPSLFAGLHYSLNDQPKIIKSVLPPLQKKWNFYLFSSAAIKQAAPLESPQGLVNLLNFEALKTISYSSRLGGGINLTYDRTLRKEIPNSPDFLFDQSKLKLEVSIYGSYEYVMGNLSFPVQLGCYLYNNYPISEIYETIGMRWKLSSHWIAAIGLKANTVHADFIQWGLGYAL